MKEFLRIAVIFFAMVLYTNLFFAQIPGRANARDTVHAKMLDSIIVNNWEFAKQYHVSAGINNFTDEKYFNRRITIYPGPGILHADGRTFYISFGIKI